MADSSSPSDSELVDWALLPGNILHTVLDKLVNLSDYIHFSETCKPWLSVAMPQKRKRVIAASKKGFPDLLIPGPTFTPDVGRHLPFRRIFCGSSHGWFATVDEKLVITLRKVSSPSREPITLPPVGEQEVFFIPCWYDYMIKKVVLTDDPDLFPDSYQVFVVFGLFRSLARIRSGEKEWTYCTNSYENNYPFKFSDVILYKGKIHASETKMSCGLVSFDESEELVPKEVVKKCWVEESDRHHKTYLVESSRGDLLLVQRFFAREEESEESEERRKRPMTKLFKVSKLSEEMSEWVEVDGIGDDVLFLGDNESMCLSARDYGGLCRKNCIYFTDDQTDVPLYTPLRDMGIYCLEDESFEELDPHQGNMPPCLWVLRKLQRN